MIPRTAGFRKLAYAKSKKAALTHSEENELREIARALKDEEC